MIKVVEIGGFGNKIRLTNGIVDIDFATDFGPRILRYGLSGRENFFYEDVDDLINRKGEEMNNFFDGAEWHIYGGHRFWQSPEAFPRTYTPDNDKVEYEITKTGVILKQKYMEYTKTDAEIEVVMSEDSADVKVIHRLRSYSPYEIELAPWTISVCNKNILEAVPLNKIDTGLLHNQTMTIWSYTKLNDERVYFGDKYVTLKQNPKATSSFKLGFTNNNKFAAIFNDNAMFVKTFEWDENANYPDDGMNFETYTNDIMLECESIGPLTKLKEGDTLTHIENWTIIDNIPTPDAKDEETIDKYLSKFRQDNK